MLKVAVVRISGKGRGVIATVAIAAGDTVERSPVLPLSLADSECPGLNEYGMAWEENHDNPTPGRECCIGLGYLSIYNHADRPNAKLEHHYDTDEISVVALRDIAAGEEITYDYVVPLWFTDAGEAKAAE
ncbi:MAG: SET domain-containing protein-lysine N-methyltransferase [Alphaproteobacteria bacterium]|nr:SET domain-containing protein-lysine N-methyltransferase [Alphaproteobacteria bacterium]MBL6936241.1 SET domain-containing protein-lysine N-methyltransferase [Alphaproteobacteria bacterium]MBL7098708.1 SET domain-containing protein-lysine N-methyltransferase [Alphaproteobacteria bacterium]